MGPNTLRFSIGLSNTMSVFWATISALLLTAGADSLIIRIVERKMMVEIGGNSHILALKISFVCLILSLVSRVWFKEIGHLKKLRILNWVFFFQVFLVPLLTAVFLGVLIFDM